MALTWKDVEQWRREPLDTAAVDMRGMVRKLGEIDGDVDTKLSLTWTYGFSGDGAESAYNSVMDRKQELQDLGEVVSKLAKYTETAADGADDIRAIVQRAYELEDTFGLQITADGKVKLAEERVRFYGSEAYVTLNSLKAGLEEDIEISPSLISSIETALFDASGSQEIGSIVLYCSPGYAGFFSCQALGGSSSVMTQSGAGTVSQTLVSESVISAAETIEALISGAKTSGEKVVNTYAEALALIAKGVLPTKKSNPISVATGVVMAIVEEGVDYASSPTAGPITGRNTWTANVVNWLNANRWVKQVARAGGPLLDVAEGAIAGLEQYESDIDEYPEMGETERVARVVTTGSFTGIGSFAGSSVVSTLFGALFTIGGAESGPVAPAIGVIGSVLGSVIGGPVGGFAGGRVADGINDWSHKNLWGGG